MLLVCGVSPTTITSVTRIITTLVIILVYAFLVLLLDEETTISDIFLKKIGET